MMNALDVDFDSWTRKSMSVIPRGSGTPIYQVETSIWSRTIKFKNTSGALLGQTSFHKLSSAFDITIAGQAQIDVNSDKFWKIQRSWNSPAFGCQMRWKSDSSWRKIDYVLLDQNDMPVARFASSNRWKKAGAIQFDPQVELNEAQVLEVVMSGISLALQIQRQQSAASSSASSSVAAATA